MKHQFRYEFDSPVTIIETQEERLEDVLRAFTDYLRGCGYRFDGEVEIVGETENLENPDTPESDEQERIPEGVCPICRRWKDEKGQCYCRGNNMNYSGKGKYQPGPKDTPEDDNNDTAFAVKPDLQKYVYCYIGNGGFHDGIHLRGVYCQGCLPIPTKIAEQVFDLVGRLEAAEAERAKLILQVASLSKAMDEGITADTEIVEPEG